MKPRKVKRKVKNETKAEAPKGASASKVATESTPQARPNKIRLLKKDVVYRGARHDWYERLKAHDGKTEGEFIASTMENPPAKTKNGTVENPKGWVRFFVRQGVMSLHT